MSGGRTVRVLLVALLGAVSLLVGPAAALGAGVPDHAAPRSLGTWGGPAAPAAVPAAEQADRLHSEFEVRADGSVVVTEHITWRFPEGEARHGIYRQVRVRAGYRDSETQYRYYELSGVEVSSPTGAPTDIAVLDDGAFRTIRIGSPSQTVTGVQEYVVRYRLAHIVNDIGDGTAEFYYDLVDPSNGVPQHDVSGTVTGPVASTRAACFYGPRGSTTPCDATPGATATFAVPDLAAEEGASIVTSYPRDAFGDLTPDLREGSAGSGSASPVSPQVARVLAWLVAGLGVLLPLLAGALMGLLVWTRGRDEQYAGLTPGLSPGVGQEQQVVRGAPPRPSPCSSPRRPGCSPG